ncbi:MAG: hypothetical protein FWD33_03710 [Alphaproteobacteria bacterium]|nr:hypothetical protein [Alphaproteobacteria bacterium]
MTVIFAILLIVAKVVQDLVSKEGTKVLDSRAIALASALFSVAFYSVAAWFVPHLWQPDPIAILYGSIAGIAIFCYVKFFNDVRRESNSSATFGLLIGFGAAVPINVWLLGETLPLHKALSCIALGIVGLIFFLRGAASELSLGNKLKFIAAVMFFMIPVSMDFLALERSNWFMVGMSVAVAYFLTSMISLKGGFDRAFISALPRPIFWVIGTVGIVIFNLAKYVQGEVLGASLTYAFIRLSVPIVMVLSAYIYRERTPREQLLFGAASYLVALPLFF